MHPDRAVTRMSSSHEADCGQTDTCENITFLAVGNKSYQRPRVLHVVLTS